MSASLPKGEQEFFDQQDIIMDGIVANMVLWGLDQARVHDVLQVQQAKYVAARNACLNPETTTPAMINHRNAMRKDYESELRIDVGGLKNNPRVSGEWLDMMRIAHGKGGGKPIDPTKQKPLVEGDTSISPQITILIRNIKTKKFNKPRGASGTRVRIGVLGADPDDHDLDKFRIDEMTVDPQKLPFQVFLSAWKYLLKFLKHQSGLKVLVSACYVNAVGEEGPWSTIEVFIIP
jgi:hypothetical protein